MLIKFMWALVHVGWGRNEPADKLELHYPISRSEVKTFVWEKKYRKRRRHRDK